MRDEILFLLEGRQVPSSRFRILQFLELLEKEKASFRILTTIPSKYLYYPDFIRATPLRYPWAVASLVLVMLTRLFQIFWYVPGTRVVVLQRELLFRVNVPILEVILFWWLRCTGKANARVLFDVDDAIFLDRQGKNSPALKRKIDFIASRCNMVIAGNEYLREYFSRLAPTVVIPTTIDSDRFSPKDWGDFELSSRPIVVGWTGTQSNLANLSALESVFLDLQAHYLFEILLICDAGAQSPFSTKIQNVRMIAWNESTEVQDLQQIDIGLMPLPDNEWTRGKCGFKLLQYMAVGIPGIASAVGVNKQIITSGVDGILVENLDAWHHALTMLLSNRALIPRMGRKAREAVSAHYDKKVWFDQWAKNVKNF